MRQKFYDSYYRALDLEPGASLEDIDRMWHILVQVWHPDRLPSGTAVHQHAVRRMQDINVARDELRAYWKAHGQAPPVGSTSGASAPPPRSHPRPQPQPHASAGASPRPGEGSGAPPPREPPGDSPPSPSSEYKKTPPKDPVPAVRKFEKTWIHHLFDWMDKNAGESNPGVAVAFGFTLLVASFGLARMVLLVFWPMDHEFTNQDSMVVLVVAFVIFGMIFRLIFASYEVYKLLEKPYFEAVPVAPNVACDRIVNALREVRYDEQTWSVQDPVANGTAHGAMTIAAKMILGEAIVTLNVRIWPSPLADWSVIGLEFDADHPWRIPAPYAPVRVTSEAIVATLNARRP
jgi:hypothetical protein